MSNRSAMRATLAKLSDKMWSEHARGTYDAVQLNDENQPLDADETGLDSERTAHADVHDELRAMLRWYQLATVALGSLLAFVCIAWAAQELGTWRVPMTSFHVPPGMHFETLSRETKEVWSPAMEAVRTKAVVFHNNFHEDRTPWQGPPTDEVDAAWDKLYKGVGVIKIPKVDAERLPNQTLAIPGEDDGYIVGIEVYHQLHCMDIIRRAMYPDRYGGDKGMNEKQKAEYWIHVDHCIDNIRQTIMCYSDVSTIPWKWHERVQGEFPDAHTTHVCRDFDALTEWMLHPDRHFPQEKYQLRVEAFHASSHAHGH